MSSGQIMSSDPQRSMVDVTTSIDQDEASVLQLQVLMLLRHHFNSSFFYFSQTHVARNMRLLMATVECAAPFAHILSAMPVGGDDGDDAGIRGKGNSELAVDHMRFNVSW
jgi:hypothetical protein